MNLTETQKQQIIQAVITAVVTLVLAVASILGYNLGIKPALDVNGGAIGAQSLGVQPAQTFRAVTAQNYLTNNGTLNQVGVSTFTGAATLATANVTTLNVGGYAQSGAVRFGSASTVISGTTIAHGFGITPTTFMIQPAYIPAATYTQTLFAHSCNTISCTVGISTGAVVTYTTVNWIGGK